jgi:hypothetical protein
MLLNMSVFQHKIMIINRSDFYFFECMIFVNKKYCGAFYSKSCACE